MEIFYDHRYYTEPTNHSFLRNKDHYLHLRNILCLWVTSIDITRSQEILLRRDFVYLCCVSSLSCELDRRRLMIALDCKYRQRTETAAKENAGEGIASRI